jgi:HSP90 family molecular chaperone
MLKAVFDYESARAKAYTIYDDASKKKHSVIYKLDKDEWSCDCTWNTLKETYCSHIKEAIRLENRKNAESLAKKLGIR